MQTINDLKEKLAEIEKAKLNIKDAEDALAKAEDNLMKISLGLYKKAREIINNTIERACCYEVLNINFIDSENVYVKYEYCCRGNDGIDNAIIPAKYFLMSEDEYKADAEAKKSIEKQIKKKAKQEAEEKAEYELYLKLKKKYE